MTIQIFLFLLTAFAVISGLVTEAIKTFVNDKAELPYNIVALVVALVVGIAGTAIYYQFNAIAFTINNVISMVLMGLASGLTSMVGFDKVKQAFLQITEKDA